MDEFKQMPRSKSRGKRSAAYVTKGSQTPAKPRVIAATEEQLRDVCAGAPESFIEEQLAKGASLEAARAEYVRWLGES